VENGAYKRHFIYFGYAVMFFLIFRASAYLISNYLLPFAVAWLCALFFQPLINACARITRIPRKVIGVILLILVLALGITLAVFLVNRAYTELKEIVAGLGGNSGRIVEKISGIEQGILDRLDPGNSGNGRYISEIITQAVDNAVERLTSGITGKLGDFAMKLPEIFFITAVFIMASFYLVADFGRVNSFVASVLPERTVSFLKIVKNRIFDAAAKYFRAYMIILGITFSELLVAFLILKVKYALVIAAGIALLDMLPAIGTGAVLAPWAIISFINGDIVKGISFAAVYLIIAVVRQIIEPHIVGNSLGIPAIVTLIAMYIGFRSAGVFGIIIAPFATVLAKNVVTYFFESKNRASTA